MPPDERATKVVDRCASHPGRPKAATCERCGRALCVECAVPVRGVAYGPECLLDVLGDDAPVIVAPRPTRSPLDRAAGVALAVASVSTLAPWTRFGTGSVWLRGAWAWDVRWSMLAAISALVAIVAWALARPGGPTTARRVCMAACVGSAVGSILAILNPPPFTRPALAPWIALIASVAALAMLRTASARQPRAGG